MLGADLLLIKYNMAAQHDLGTNVAEWRLCCRALSRLPPGPRPAEEERRKLKRTSADGENSITGQGRVRNRRAEGRRRAPLCCAELQMLCTQSIGYYSLCRQKGGKKKKNKANSMCLLSHKILHDTLPVAPQTLPYQHCRHPLQRLGFPPGGQQCNLQ